MTGKVTVSDVRKAGYCVRGIKNLWPGYGFSISFREFLKDGIDIDEAAANPDPNVQRSVAIARERIKKENS